MRHQISGLQAILPFIIACLESLDHHVCVFRDPAEEQMDLVLSQSLHYTLSSESIGITIRIPVHEIVGIQQGLVSMVTCPRSHSCADRFRVLGHQQ